MRTAVGRDDARAAEHLDLDGHVAGALRDAVVVVVGRRAHRAGHAARDAALEGAAIEPGVGAASVRAGAAKRRPLRLVGRALLRLLGQRRHAAVRRIDHQRRAQRRHLRAAIPPEVVVGALDVAARPFRSPFVAALFLRALLERRHFLGREELAAADVGRTLERRDRPVGERALQVGLAPRRARGGPVPGAGRIGAFSPRGLGKGGQRRQHRRRDCDDEEALVHGAPSYTDQRASVSRIESPMRWNAS